MKVFHSFHDLSPGKSLVITNHHPVKNPIQSRPGSIALAHHENEDFIAFIRTLYNHYAGSR